MTLAPLGVIADSDHFVVPGTAHPDLLLAAMRPLDARLADSRKAQSGGGPESKWAPAAKTDGDATGMFVAEMCDHLFDTTSRYDAERKLLTFILFCPACGTEQKVVETMRYEPAFRPTAADGGRAA